MARVLKGSHSFTCTVHTPRSFANGMNHTCLCLPSRSCSTHLPTPKGWKQGKRMEGRKRRKLKGRKGWIGQEDAPLPSINLWLRRWSPASRIIQVN